MIPDTYGNYRYASSWVCYLHSQELINEDLYNHISMLLAAPRLSKEEAQGIEYAEKLIPLFPEEFKEHLRLIRLPVPISCFKPVDHIEIKL